MMAARRALFRAAFAALMLTVTVANAAPVLMISIDGLRPDYVTRADAHGLKIPRLRRFLRAGSYAEGVIGVTPTMTYPNHTTLVTGVDPIEHGIYNNRPFDPTHDNDGGENWYARDIKVQTLWQAASAAGHVTASVAWPVTVAADGIRYCIPEYGLGATDDIKLIEAVAQPAGYLRYLEQRLGAYTDQGLEPGDLVRTRFALQIIKDKKPSFMTVHLTALDGVSHAHGPFSAEANASLEALDAMIAQLQDAALANNPASVTVVISDHGFVRVNHLFNGRVPFAKAGLIDPQAPEWTVDLWMGGGSAAVMLRDPLNTKLYARVASLLREAQNEAPDAIAQVLTGNEARALRGWPGASFVIDLQPGYLFGSASSGPLVAPMQPGGAHGYLPGHSQMHAAFFVMGDSIGKAHNVGLIDSRQIAPTLAALLGVKLPAATAQALDLHT